MQDLYPLRLQPEFSRRIWGAQNLAPIYSYESPDNPIGESWLTGDDCKVANGLWAGRSLADLSRQFGRDLLGDAVPDVSRFPLLIKFLFPKDKVSVQVHPDDEAAARVGQPCGKTECWYVVQAEAGARIGLGLKPGTTKAEVERAIHQNRMEQLLNWVGLRAGDLIYVDAGTVHTIGPGAVILEIQQNSDTTYRLYDYGRPRELHIAAGMQATKESTRAGKVEKKASQAANGKSQVNLITSPFFVVDKFKLSHAWEFRRRQNGRSSVWCLVAIGGSGVISSNHHEPISLSCGEAVAVPAVVDKFTVTPQGDVEFLCASLPGERVPQPKTVLAGSSLGVAQQRPQANS
jgi:mannose-6-phosphate isomerase